MAQARTQTIYSCCFSLLVTDVHQYRLSKSEYAGNIRESIEFRFQSRESIEWQDEHIGVLTKTQLEAVEAYFEFLFSQPLEYKPFVEDCLRTIRRYLSTKASETC